MPLFAMTRPRSAFAACLLPLASAAFAQSEAPPANATTSPAAVEAPLPKDAKERSAEIARLVADLEAKQALYGKSPRRKFLTASSTAPEYAPFMREFVDKIEKAGTDIYPEEAKRRGLSGKVLLTVAINRDGSLREIIIHKSSGVRILDVAAQEAVRKAAPFSPLPITDENVDVLEITRTFLFKNGSLPTELGGSEPAGQKTP